MKKMSKVFPSINFSDSETERHSQAGVIKHKTPSKPKKKRPTQEDHNESTDEQSTEDNTTQEHNLNDLIRTCRQILQELKNEEVPDHIKIYHKQLRQKLQILDKKTSEQNDDILKLVAINNQLQKKSKEYHDLLGRMIHRFPTDQELSTTIADAISTKVKEMQTYVEQTLRQELLALTNEVTPPDSATQASPNLSSQHPTARGRDPPPTGPTDEARRTILIKGRKNQTGNEIMDLLSMYHFQVGSVQRAEVRRYAVELLISTRTLKEQIRNELANHKNFKVTHNVTDLPLRKEKLILLGIPDHCDNDLIKDSIAHTHDIPTEEIQILNAFKNKSGGKNLTFVIPEEEAYQLLQSGGFMLGPRFVPVRPFISVQRCRRCQHLGHSDRRCSKLPLCVNCGEAHESINPCSVPSRCVNCIHHNRNNSLKYSINHKASDSACPTYQDQIQLQKERTYQYYDIPLPPPRRRREEDRPTPLLPTPTEFYDQRFYRNFPQPPEECFYRPPPQDFPPFWMATGRRPPL